MRAMPWKLLARSWLILLVSGCTLLPAPKQTASERYEIGRASCRERV